MTDKNNSKLILKLPSNFSNLDALWEIKERYLQLVEVSPNTVIIHQDGKIVFINKSGVKLLGARDAAEIIGNPLLNYVHHNSKQLVKNLIQDMIQNGSDAPMVEQELLRVDGSPVDAEVLASPVIYQGKPAIQIIARDISEQKKSEASLKAEQERLYSLLDNLPGFVYLQGADYSVHYTNYKFNKIFGDPGDKKCYQLIGQLDNPCAICETFEVFETGKPINWEYMSNGRYYDVYVYPFSHSNDTPLLLVLGVDITDRKIVEKNLRRSEAKHRTLFETMKQGVMYVNAQEEIVSVNPAMEDILGIPSKLLNGRKLEHPSVINEAGSVVPRNELPAIVSLRTGKEIKNTVVAVYNPKEIRYRWLNVNAIPQFKKGANKPYQTYTTFEDITDRKLIERKLRHSEKRLYKTINACPVLISLHRLNDGVIVDVNEYFIKTTGFSRDELVGYTFAEIGMLTADIDIDKHIKFLRTTTKKRNLEVDFLTKTGELRHGLTSTEVLDIDGQPHILIATNDVTEIKMYEQEMLRLDRLNLVGEMAAGIGHEIRNPLTTVRGLLQILKAKDEFNTHESHFSIMIDELDRANAIITEYLSLARKKPSTLEMQNLNTIIEMLYPLIQADAMETGNDVTTKLDIIPDISINGKEIRQLILNLTRNGLEAMDSGGVLTLNTYVQEDEVVLAIRDQGKGIDPLVLEKVGTPFVTTKNEGTGLGLSICYSIANRHNARIDIETGSTGTTFFVRFKNSNN
ncbi:MAG: PAS domain S-box protein [Firmicutes bacterium]|nr:PAS domain S-box protein [Bacillota bacterium]